MEYNDKRFDRVITRAQVDMRDLAACLSFFLKRGQEPRDIRELIGDSVRQLAELCRSEDIAMKHFSQLDAYNFLRKHHMHPNSHDSLRRVLEQEHNNIKLR